MNKAGKFVIEQPFPMRKQVYKHLRDQILSNEIKPGGRLVEAQIAKTLGVSRTPVREAVHLLERDGFIESIPRVGYRVRKLIMEELDEIFEIRKANELLACTWAAKKAPPGSLKSLEKNIKMTRAALNNDQPELFLDLDQEFHSILVQASGSHHLAGICRQLGRLMLRYRIDSITDNDAVTGALKGHIAIYEALKNKDEKGLKTALEDHLCHSKQDIDTRLTVR